MRSVNEILYVKRQYPLELVHFSDDIFALDKSWLEDFSVRYKKMIDLPFNCNVRISHIDEDTVKLLSAAGCNAVTFGLESGNEFLRNKIILKNTTNRDIIEKAALLKKYAIKILTSNMIALPHENISNVYETIQLNRRIGVDYIRIYLTKPFKGTRIFEYGQKNHLLNDKAYNCDSFEHLDNVYFKIGREREFKNLRYLFYLVIRLPVLEGVSRLLIKLPLTRAYEILFFITTVIQEQRFFRVRFFKGIILSLRLMKGFGKHF